MQQAELLSDDDRRMVGQHDPPSSQPDIFRHRRQVSEDYRWCACADIGDGMVFGDPETVKSELVGDLRERRRPLESELGRYLRTDGDDVEDG